MIKYGKKINGIDSLIPSCIRALSSRQDVQAIYLFGSRAVGKTDDLSDIDIAILMDYDHMTFDAELDLLGEINTLLRTDEVSLVILNNAPLSIAYGIIKDAKVLYSRDDRVRLYFEEIVMRKYFDFRYYLDSFDREFILVVRCENRDR